MLFRARNTIFTNSLPIPPYCFPSPDATVTFLMKSLSTDDGDVNENGKQATGLDWQNNNSAVITLFVHFFAVTARLRRENS